MTKLKLKLNTDKGFTLTELLAVIVIIVLITAVVAGGMPTIQKTYSETVDYANAQTILSTAMTELRASLSTASDIEISEKVITYTDIGTGQRNSIETTESGLLLKIGLSENTIERYLVSQKASTAGMHVEYEELELENGILTIKGLSVLRNNKKAAEIEEFSVKTFDA